MNYDVVLQAGLIAASIALAAYCAVLSRRLRRLNNLESGLGGAIAVMCAEIERLEKAIRLARDEATVASNALSREISAARGERARWDLQQRIHEATLPPTARRLRKRAELRDA
ncbi:hypothetical protein JJJ17_03550 [Paracoccus caeni]|uniref:Uncharacterized protein n=1 Tax=Paracoccus caeni TaxID=657651 RepID=A0A934VTR0_9RHOB|nr:hypothetical protein [Paracoccus caeni]MBK4214996.1 hypothetical protein [Paracoccus caeni]